MTYGVTLETLRPRLLAAVRRRVAIGRVGVEVRPALDIVWAFLRTQPGLRTDGHNVLLYLHDSPAVMTVDFGVEVTRKFPDAGDVTCVSTPVGEAAVVIHRGPYEQLHAAHEALHAWCARHNRVVGDHSIEVYGDWSDDPARLETTVQYLLR
jgi:effector-binding domain-containing protein